MDIFYGRRKLIASVSEQQLNADNIKTILLEVLPIHSENVREINELDLYRLGKQDILDKKKKARPEINHKVIENYAFSIVDFKMNYVHGNPLSYVQNNDADIKEVERLNSFMSILGKQTLDKNLGQSRYTFGTGYRIVLPKKANAEQGEVPFEIYNLSAKNTACVYSSGFRANKLFAFNYADFKHYDTKHYHREYYVYTKNRYFVFKTDPIHQDVNINYGTVQLELVTEIPHYVGHIPIIEYELNDDRFGLVELIKTQQDALNFLTSSELDDLDQFIQSIIVLTNTKLSEEGKKSLTSSSILEIQSLKNAPADAKILSQITNHTELKIYYDRIHRAMMSIAGIPIMSDKNGGGGDTGQARLVGEGWTMADEKAKSDEFTFEKGEKELLTIVLDICHKKGLFKTLKNENIQVKFNRNRSDNLQTKVQALQGLMSSGVVAPDDALRTSELFQNYIEVYQKGQVYAEEKRELDLQYELKRNKALQQDNQSKEQVETDNKKKEVIE